MIKLTAGKFSRYSIKQTRSHEIKDLIITSSKGKSESGTKNKNYNGTRNSNKLMKKLMIFYQAFSLIFSSVSSDKFHSN